ncbi:MAG: PD-(D/E)XK nuclease family protein [Halanaerobiales bacterium]|nr:PD-(D/E)XK nuclease family protein [Halanaerobiales bacterium]
MEKILYGSVLCSGRSKLIEACTTRIDLNGVRFAYLVPTYQLQKEIESALINYRYFNNQTKYQGHLALHQPQIFLFDGFVNEMLKDWMEYQKPISSYQQKIILKSVACNLFDSGRLSELGEMLKYDGFYVSLLQWLTEVRGAGQTPESWLKIYADSKKECELGYIFKGYNDFLIQHELVDQETNYECLIQGIEKTSLERNNDLLSSIDLVVVDGFSKLNHLQVRLIKTLISAGKEVILHTFLEEDRNELFLSVSKMIDRLKEESLDTDWNWEVEKLKELETEIRKNTLNHLCLNLFNLDARQIDGDDSITIMYTPDEYQEVEAIGRQIKQMLLKDNIMNIKLDEIAIVFRDVKYYHPIVEEIFRDLEIPYQISLGNLLSQTPLFKLILKIYNIFTNDWSTENVTEVMNSQYLKIENTSDLDIKQTFFEKLSLLAKSQSFYDHSERLLEFLAFYNLDEQVLKTNDHQVLRRDLLSLERLQQLLSEMIKFGDLLNSDKISQNNWSYQEFIKILMEAAQEIEIPEVDLKIDAVQIMTSSQSRGRKFKYVYISGLLEGDFPRYGQRDWLFTPEERKKLLERGIYFKQWYEQMEEEGRFFLEAISTASERLILTCPTFEHQASSFIKEVLNLFSEDTINQENVTIGEKIKVDEDYVPLTEWEREEYCLKNVVVDDMLKRDISEDRFFDLYQRSQMIKSREGTVFTEFDGILKSDDVIKRLQKAFHSERVYSISQLNGYANCPFQFFCSRILDLEEMEEPKSRLEALDLGNLYHQILFLFFRDFPGWEKEPLEESLERLERLVNEVMANFVPGMSLPNGLMIQYQEEILKKLQRIISYEYEDAAKLEYQMTPKYLEASFGLNQDYQEDETLNVANPLEIRYLENDGSEKIIKFKGKIDRIDESQDGKYLVLYDYKLGTREGFAEIEEGIDLQLPIYIKSASHLCGEEKIVLGAGYFALNKCDRKAGIWRDLCQDLIPVGKRSKSCLTDDDWEDVMAKVDEYIIDYINKIRAGEFPVNPKKCQDYCKFKKICRYESSRIRRMMTERSNGGDLDGI